MTINVERTFHSILKVLDDNNALKTRDEFLGFRRRFRFLQSMPRAPYTTHMEDTVRRLPEYVAYFKADSDRFGDLHEQTEALRNALVEMLRTARA